MKGERGSGGITPIVPHLGDRLEVGGWLRPRSGRCIHGEAIRYPLYGMLLGLRDRHVELWFRISNRPASCESLYRQHYRVRQTYVCQVSCKNDVWTRSNMTASTWTNIAAWIEGNKKRDVSSCLILFEVCSLGYKNNWWFLIISNYHKFKYRIYWSKIRRHIDKEGFQLQHIFSSSKLYIGDNGSISL